MSEGIIIDTVIDIAVDFLLLLEWTSTATVEDFLLLALVCVAYLLLLSWTGGESLSMSSFEVVLEVVTVTRPAFRRPLRCAQIYVFWALFDGCRFYCFCFLIVYPLFFVVSSEVADLVVIESKYTITVRVVEKMVTSQSSVAFGCKTVKFDLLVSSLFCFIVSLLSFVVYGCAPPC